MFRATDAPECTMWLTDPTKYKLQVRHNVSPRTFVGICTDTIRAWKIVLWRYVPRKLQNALHGQQIPPDAKTQVWHNLFRRTFGGIHTAPTRARKIVRRWFTPQTHRNALRDPTDPTKCKTQVQRNLSRCAFCGFHIGPKWEWKIVRWRSCPGCTRMHYVIRRSHRMQKHKFGVTCPGALFVEYVPVPPKHEK
jgi:hypothetical protein